MHKVILRGASYVFVHEETPDINPKYYTGFNRHEELNTEDFVDFYKHLTIKLRRFGIGLMEFDVVQPKWMHVGLTYQMVGEIRYVQMAEELFNLLQKTLPMTDPVVNQAYTTLEGDNHDGYKLLRLIMGKSIPAFCSYKTSIIPKWSQYQDVARMSKLWKLHFRLAAKKGSSESPVEQSLQFLQSLQDPILAPHITSIRGQIQAFVDGIDEFDDDENALPTTLTIDGITTTLTQFPTAIDSSITYARSNHTTFEDLSDDEVELNFQGSASASTTTSTRSRDNRSRGGNRNSTDNRRKTTGRRASTGETADVTCRGCHKKGHQEVDCRELAKWIIISNNVKKLPDRQRKKVMENYYKFYSTAPPSPSISRSCVQQLRNFCSSRSMTTEQVVNNFNWDGYVAYEGTDGDEGFETAPEDGEDSE
jgi:hypothetical protein